MSLAPGPAQSENGLGAQACDCVIHCSSELGDFSFALPGRMTRCTLVEYVEHLNRALEHEGHMLHFSAPFP